VFDTMALSEINRRRFLTISAKAAGAYAVLNIGVAQGWGVESTVGEGVVNLAAGDLAKDPRRPQFHLLPASNWMNDPNGPIYWKGRYHMFFQYNPHAAVWGDMHWAHAVSADMVHWKHLPVALAPTPGGPDAEGCFSGTAVVRDGVVTFIYTGVVRAPEDQATLLDGAHSLRESQCYATSTDSELKTWTKRAAPVIAAPPKDLHVTGFRDPSPWRDKDSWYMAVGSGLKGKGGAVLLYKSGDLQNWEYMHLLCGGEAAGTANANANNPVDSGDMWECPDFFALGDKHVLIYSTQGKVFWQTGELDTTAMVFHAGQSGVLDYGSFYAPKTQLDKHGNRILWGWIQETRPVAEYSASGWAGLMSLPRVLTMGGDGRLRIGVAQEVEKLRGHEEKLRLVPVPAGGKEMISDGKLKGACGELLCVVKPTPEPFTLDLLSPVDPTDATAVGSQSSFLSLRYSQANPKELVVDQQRLPIHLAADEALELRFFVDGSAIELFVNGQITCTKRFYYPGPVAPEIAVSVTGKAGDVSRLSLWQLAPISKDRLTS
jgi:beta-fructofuranosidase